MIRWTLARFFHVHVIAFLLTAFNVLAQTKAPTTDLYYFVIDRSGSINQKSLAEPFRKAVTEFVDDLAVDTHIELVFFHDKAERPESWYPLDAKTKADFKKYFERYFKPEGQTLLYDTVADVIQRIIAMESKFRHVTIVILSDGDDNRSKKHTSWTSVEKMIPEHWAKDAESSQQFRIVWQTVGYEPKPDALPSAQGPIDWVMVLKPEDIRKWFLPPPNAKFTAHPRKVKVGDPVLFILDDPLGVVTVQWSVGDGTQYNQKQFTHKYSAEGVYDITTEVTGTYERADRLEQPGYIQVTQVAPLESRFSWHPVAPKAGDEIKLIDESTGEPTARKWEIQGLAARTEQHPTIKLDSPGKFAVMLSVTKEGQTQSSQRDIIVRHQPPVAAFTASPLELEFGQTLSLAADKTQPDWTHHWTINEGVTLEGSTAIWTSDQAGRVEVVHSVSGPGGMVDAVKTVLVREKPADLVPRFNWAPVEVRVGTPIQFVDESEGAPQSWVWEIAGVTYAERSPLITFTDTDSVKVTLTIEQGGRQASTDKMIEVLPPLVALQAAFDINTKRGTAPLTVEFTDKSKGQVSTWQWDFGEGQTSDAKNPVHTYDKPGAYTPRLTIRDSLGSESKDEGGKTIVARAPIPAWIKWTVLLVGLGLLWLFVLVPLLTAGARRKAMSMTLDLGGGEARTVAESLPGRFSSLKSLLLPVLEVKLGSGVGGSTEIPGCETPCVAILSPKGDGGCEIRAMSPIYIDGEQMDRGGNRIQYPPSRTRITPEGASEVTLILEDPESDVEV